MTQKSISIITINYNNAAGLQKTFNSVRKLTFRDFEYIVIDGGSTDESRSIIEQNSDIITKAVLEPDKGIYDALNKGIQLASGSLIGLIHSGDAFLPDALTGLLSLHEKHTDVILYGALKTVNNGVFDSVWGWNADVLPRQMIPHLASFVPKSVYEQYGTYDLQYPIAADYDCFLRFYQTGVPFLFIDKIICEFNLNGISQRESGNATEQEVNTIKKAHGVYTPPSVKKQIKTAIKKIIRF